MMSHQIASSTVQKIIDSPFVKEIVIVSVHGIVPLRS